LHHEWRECVQCQRRGAARGTLTASADKRILARRHRQQGERAFGVRPRTWLEELHYRPRDRALMIAGAAMLVVSTALAYLGFGSFWIPEALRSLPLL